MSIWCVMNQSIAKFTQERYRFMTRNLRIGTILFLMLLVDCKNRNSSQVLQENLPPSNQTGEGVLKMLIENSPAAAKDKDPIAYLISLLPTEMHYNYVIARAPQGAQHGSSSYPRVITALADASLIASFNGSSKDDGFYRLEIIFFRKETGKFEMNSIEFEQTSSGFRTIPVHPNPPLCLSCHGDDPKPVWGPYRNWKGFYGSNDDLVAPKDKIENNENPEISDKEYQQFQAFRKIAAQSDRYKQLQLLDKKDEYAPFTNQGFDLNAFRRPNLRFGNVLAYNMGVRQAHLIKENQYFQTVAHGLAAELGGCEISAKIKSSISARFPNSQINADSYIGMGIKPPFSHVLATMASPDQLVYSDPFGIYKKEAHPLNDGGANNSRYRLGMLNTVLGFIKEDALIRKPLKYYEKTPSNFAIPLDKVIGAMLPDDEDKLNGSECASLIKVAEERLR